MSRRITALDRERFSNGDCLILAQELHKLTDWPIYALHNNNDWAQEGEPDDHAFVLAPGRKVVDITGVHSVTTIVRQWGAAGYVAAPEMLDGGWFGHGETEDYPGSRRRARQLAPHLATMVNL